VTIRLRLASALACCALLGHAGLASAAGPVAPLPARVEQNLAWQGQADLDGDLTVAPGATLVLEKGTRLRFAAGRGITVEGALEVRGGDGPEPGVTFSARGKEAWRGIAFAAGASGTLAGARIADAAVGLTGNGARIALSGSALERCGRGASFTAGSDFSVRDCRFACREVGVEALLKSRGEILRSAFTGGDCGVGVGSAASLRIAGNRFEKAGIGVLANQGFSCLVERNLFARCPIGVRVYQGGTGGTIERNIFVDSAECAVQALASSSPAIINNRMERGKTGVYAFQFSSPGIGRNLIAGFAQALHLDRKADARVTRNLIARNKVGVFLDYSSYPLLRDNAFEDNGVHIALGRFESSQWEASVGSAAIVKKTAGEAGSRNQRLGNGPGSFPSAVDASGNWWDAKTAKEMDAKGEKGDIASLTDGHDLFDIVYEGFGEGKYRVDDVVFSPRLGARPPAGLWGWSGKEGELLVDGRGVVEGRVIGEDGAPSPGAQVAAFASHGMTGEPDLLSAPAGPEGLYSLRLPPGNYALAAGNGDLFSAAGQNPVTVAAGESMKLGFVLLPWTPVERRKADGPEAGGDGAVNGRVTLRGQAVEGVTVSLYLDADDFFRGPAFLSVPAGADGSFSLEMVPPGSYYLVARKRGSGQAVGPMARGDLFGYHRENPIAVAEGETVTLGLPLIEKKLDRDVNALGLPGAQPGFGGTVRGPDGKPLAGLHAFAYLEPEMGHHKPAAVSSLTDSSGRYTLYLPGPGRYYVGARAGFGDSPAPGEWFGFWQGNPEHAIDLAPGKLLSGIDIAVDKVLQ
jgi:parallel beta-helix repeat protein